MRERTLDFGVYPRFVNGKIIYYFWIYNPDGTRKYTSTGQTNLILAQKYVNNLYNQDNFAKIRGRLFRQVFKDFFIYDKCPYIEFIRFRNHSYSRTWAARQRHILESFLIPQFGDRCIANISTVEIEKWLIELAKKDIGKKSINHIISTIKVLFGYLHYFKTIRDNPAESIRPFKTVSREKGIFTKQEIAMLLFDPKSSNHWASDIYLTFNQVAAMTGMRLGEILALKPDAIVDNTLHVFRSWNEMDGLKSTKSNKPRRIPIPPTLALKLKNMSKEEEDAFIFPNTKGDKPIDHKSVYRSFYDALEKIGISSEDRIKRNITFHSYRHTYNTRLLEGGVHPEFVRLCTGHASNAMTSAYAHIQSPVYENII